MSRGDSYAFDPRTSRADALSYWFAPGTEVVVAESDDAIVGTYILRANQPGLGDHVGNAAFMVAPQLQKRGVGRAMATHCLAEAARAGFRAMQFNYVISTNEPAIALWTSLGFAVAGTLRDAFRHRQLGFVDVYVMCRALPQDDSIGGK